MSSQAYDAQVSAMHLETKYNSDKEAFEIFKETTNETNKKIIEMLSQIILQNEKIYEKITNSVSTFK